MIGSFTPSVEIATRTYGAAMSHPPSHRPKNMQLGQSDDVRRIRLDKGWLISTIESVSLRQPDRTPAGGEPVAWSGQARPADILCGSVLYSHRARTPCSVRYRTVRAE